MKQYSKSDIMIMIIQNKITRKRNFRLSDSRTKRLNSYQYS